ncbi:hypothetical protein OUZ56_001945 [Daphnia magna]|uniref:Uncharacterized protein n=1 Tax=Daphnia magna TaxID=35525 RepID=A0ABR0A489_9CRUS|nr:hypothetical protein OUZ56_001945 [Daphnia magna]
MRHLKIQRSSKRHISSCQAWRSGRCSGFRYVHIIVFFRPSAALHLTHKFLIHAAVYVTPLEERKTSTANSPENLHTLCSRLDASFRKKATYKTAPSLTPALPTYIPTKHVGRLLFRRVHICILK